MLPRLYLKDTSIKPIKPIKFSPLTPAHVVQFYMFFNDQTQTNDPIQRWSSSCRTADGSRSDETKVRDVLLLPWTRPCFPAGSERPRRSELGWRTEPRRDWAPCWNWRPPGSSCLKGGTSEREVSSQQTLIYIIIHCRKRNGLRGLVVLQGLMVDDSDDSVTRPPESYL